MLHTPLKTFKTIQLITQLWAVRIICTMIINYNNEITVTCTYDSHVHVTTAVSIMYCKYMEHTGDRLGQAGLFCSNLSLWQFRRYKQYYLIKTVCFPVCSSVIEFLPYSVVLYLCVISTCHGPITNPNSSTNPSTNTSPTLALTLALTLTQ